MVLRRIGALSLAKVMCAVYAVMGLIIGAILAVFSLFGAAIGASSAESAEPFLGVLFGVGAVVFLPIFYGVMGFLAGLIGAGLYNTLAGVVGGIQVELMEG